MTNDCKTCPVSTGTHKPAEAVHQIDEPQADALLELAAYRFTVENRDARIAELEAQLAAYELPVTDDAGREWIVSPPKSEQRAAAPQAVQADEKSQAAPCVTPADVEAAITSEHYYTGQIAAETESQHRALGGILNCTLVMKNGHLVSGEALLQDLSKPDPERAQASARRRAFDKAYDMVVYAERERLAATHPTQQGMDALDAARYRWLRERDLETVHKGGVFAGMTPENYVINGVDLDAAIDAAIAAQAKQGSA